MFKITVVSLSLGILLGGIFGVGVGMSLGKDLQYKEDKVSSIKLVDALLAGPLCHR